MAEPSYQSLYRRFRPQRFSEIRGQDHVVSALLGASRADRVAHAYLFSGPRGTGKTSAARILAKALNCAQPSGGEPCGSCDSCEAVTLGRSLDVHELDAASHNGVDAMRDLISRAPLGSPGRWKVYIVDEVHMLSTAASNALLKTLEEPPAHVVFVLATTDPHKVLPTIRSRTQHFEFRLLDQDTLAELVHEIDQRAELGLGPEMASAAVRKGRGSARDTLSALDQLVAAGGVDQAESGVAEILSLLAAQDPPGVLRACASVIDSGRDPAAVASELVEELRQAFLSKMGAASRPGQAGEEGQADSMGPAALVRALEVIGQAQVGMRDSLDPRINLEVALVRLAAPELDHSPEALLSRIERLEHSQAASPSPITPTDPGGPGLRDPAPPAADRGDKAGPIPGEHGGSGGPETPRPVPARRGSPKAETNMAAVRDRLNRAAPRPGQRPDQSRPAVRPSAPPLPPSPASGAADPDGPGEPREGGQKAAPGREELVIAWGDSILETLSQRARARFRAGRFLEGGQGKAVFALPDETHKAFCEPCRAEVEQAITAHFGTHIALELAVEPASADPPRPPRGGGSGVPEGPRADRTAANGGREPNEEDMDLADLGGDGERMGTITQRILEAFPGAEEIHAD